MTEQFSNEPKKADDEYVPKVGDLVEWDEAQNPYRAGTESCGSVTGTVVRVGNLGEGYVGIDLENGRLEDGALAKDWNVSIRILRKLDAYSPPAPRPTCPGEGGYACNCAHCSKPPEPKRDPYAEHRKKLSDDQAYAAMVIHDRCRLETMKPAERRKRQAMQQLSRPLPSAHPVSWPAGSYDDVDELGSA